MYDLPDDSGHFGTYGGVFVAETLIEALDELKNDKVIREALGDFCVEKLIEAKTAEWDSYRLSVTQWELDRYLEMY